MNTNERNVLIVEGSDREDELVTPFIRRKLQLGDPDQISIDEYLQLEYVTPDILSIVFDYRCGPDKFNLDRVNASKEKAIDLNTPMLMAVSCGCDPDWMEPLVDQLFDVLYTDDSHITFYHHLDRLMVYQQLRLELQHKKEEIQRLKHQTTAGNDHLAPVTNLYKLPDLKAINRYVGVPAKQLNRKQLPLCS